MLVVMLVLVLVLVLVMVLVGAGTDIGNGVEGICIGGVSVGYFLFRFEVV